VSKTNFSYHRWAAGLVGPGSSLCQLRDTTGSEVPADLVVPSLQIEIVAGVEVEDATLDML